MANPFEKALNGDPSGIEDALKYIVGQSPALSAFSSALQKMGLIDEQNPIAQLPTPASYEAPQQVALSKISDPQSNPVTPQSDQLTSLQDRPAPITPKPVPTTTYTPPVKTLDPFNTKNPNKDQSQLPAGPMVMTPQEKHLYDTHRSNLLGPGGVDNPDGTRASLTAKSFGINGKTYVLPTVYDGKHVPDQEAIDRAEKIGFDKFPTYPNEKKALDRYMQLHQYMEQDSKNFQLSREELQRRFKPSLSPMSMRAPGDITDGYGYEDTPINQLKGIEGEMNYNTQRPPRTDGMPPGQETVFDQNPTPNGQEWEDDWQRWNNTDTKTKTTWIDPARYERNERQVQMHGDPETLRTVALDPMLAEAQRDALGFLSRNGNFTGKGQQYAGDVVPLPITPGPNAGPTPHSGEYAVGKRTDPKIPGIGLERTQDWIERMRRKPLPGGTG